MITSRQIYSQFIRQIRAGMIPSALTERQREVLICRYSQAKYKSFSFVNRYTQLAKLTESFIHAAKSAEAFAKELVEPEFCFYSYEKSYITVRGYTQQSDKFLIQKCMLEVKRQEKEKQKIRKNKQLAKEKLASTQKFYTMKSDELARLVKQLINVGKTK